MSLTLVQKQQKIKEGIDKLLVDSKDELLKKKVITPENLTVNRIPFYISLIARSEFEWNMNFQLIDSVGSPRIPNSGQSWYGSNISLNADSFSSEVDDFWFLAEPINFTTNYSIINNNGVYNKYGWLTINSQISLYNTIDVAIPKIFNFSQTDSIENNLNTFNESDLLTKTNFKTAVIDTNKCTKCNRCLTFCPIKNAITFDSSTETYNINSNKCFGEDCNKCVDRCTYNAISLQDISQE